MAIRNYSIRVDLDGIPISDLARVATAITELLDLAKAGLITMEFRTGRKSRADAIRADPNSPELKSLTEAHQKILAAMPADQVTRDRWATIRELRTRTSIPENSMGAYLRFLTEGGYAVRTKVQRSDFSRPQFVYARTSQETE